MKKLFLASLALVFLAASISLFQMSSCTKAIAQTKTDTVYNKCPDSLTKTQILLQKTWMIDQLECMNNCILGIYVRGGKNTTGYNYDINRYTFKPYGTAIYTGEDGVAYNATWQFASSDERTITFTYYKNGIPYINNWEMVEICRNYIHVTEHYYGSNGEMNMHSYRLIQVQQ